MFGRILQWNHLGLENSFLVFNYKFNSFSGCRTIQAVCFILDAFWRFMVFEKSARFFCRWIYEREVVGGTLFLLEAAGPVVTSLGSFLLWVIHVCCLYLCHAGGLSVLVLSWREGFLLHWFPPPAPSTVVFLFSVSLALWREGISSSLQPSRREKF